MIRLSYRLYLLASALNYHIPRRFTKAGLLAGTGMIMAGAIGSDLDQSVAFQAFALLFCLLLTGAAWALFFRGRFTVERRLPRLATVDQPFRYRVRVRNGSARSYRDLELMEDLADPRPTLDEFTQLMRPPAPVRAFRLSGGRPRMEHRPALIQPAPLPPLGPGRTAEAEVEVVPLRRGPLHLRGSTIARRDPLGLFRAFARVRLPQTVLVLPRRHRVPQLAFASERNYQPGGVSLASSIGESDEFVGLRDYRPGDPFRRIHWRSWARAGRPIVKEHQDEYFVRHALVLDTFVGNGQPEVFEEAVSVAASFACSLDTQESLLDLLFAGKEAFCFTWGRGLGSAEHALEVLASVQANRQGHFDDLRHLVLQHAAVLSACVCVLLDWENSRQELVRQLRMTGLPLLVLLVASEAVEKRIRQNKALDLSGVHCLRPGAVAEGLMNLAGKGGAK